MKVRLEEGLQLVITPESYVEQVALSKWADTVEGKCALLVEAYAQHGVEPTVLPRAYLASELSNEQMKYLLTLGGSR